MNKYHILLLLLLLLSSESFASLDIINFLDPTKNKEKNETKETNEIEFYTQKMDYLEDIQPIFNSRCVVCHSCYNSPCQLKLSSYEGVTRGATKKLVYDGTRLKAESPTRIFIDANSTSQWRKKSFFNVLNNRKNQQNSSILMQLLTLKKNNSLIEGEYNSDTDLNCPNSSLDMFKYTTFHSHKGMPFGLPEISEDEYKRLASWIYQGQSGYTQAQSNKIKDISTKVKKELLAFENFLNKDDAKHQMSARYIYEHLFLAHVSFESAPDEFYELVRSYTPSPQPIDIVKTILPYDIQNSKKFYYRFRKIHSTIVYKTHIVFNMSMKKLQRLNSLFIEPQWDEEPHLMPYTKDMNPFVTYAQIPATSRYKFLLDNAEYITRTFIRGPVCKGQIALNVIHDHFWVMFIDPKHDLTITKKGFLKSQFKNLTTPIVLGDNAPILDSFTDKYINLSNKYFNNKVKLYKENSLNGIGIENIWKGYKSSDAPVLTIHRHFDSASVIKGALGEMPRTLWVIDYSLFERIYYALVAGFDVYGNVSHQINIRRYMDVLRMEGEMNFIGFMPKDKREKILQSWYIGDNSFAQVKEKFPEISSNIKYKNENVTQEFAQLVVNNHILKSTNIDFDKMNFIPLGESIPQFPANINSKKEIEQAFKALIEPGSGFIKYINGNNANIAFLKISNIPDSEDKFYTLIVNRWHDNVNALFNENDRLDPSKDTLDIYEGSIGSYPNFFFVVDYKDIDEFLDMLMYFKPNKKYYDKVVKFGVVRSDKNFWNIYDWFQAKFMKSDKINAGLYDLTKYYSKPLEIDHDMLIEEPN